ncbi:MAG: glutamate synthase subunit beta [Oscillospiraceae bacterium]|nr:glutamate synthase subunit beta [Oscillospiraceae bacterium]
MGKTTGFLEYKRMERPCAAPGERIEDFREFHGELSLQDRQLQGARCMSCGVPFCQSGFGCPLHNLIPEWNDEIYNGNWAHALDRLLKTNSFPEFTGRVCPALCEAACTCGLDGEPISIRDNELALVEYGYANGLIEPAPPAVRTGRQVAVVGSGPAGLAAADRLNKRGHGVTVFEQDDRVGGLLMYGIPNMKLDKSVIDRRIQRMEAEGVTFRTGVKIGRDMTGDALLKEYDAVILCCGAREPRTVDYENTPASGVYQALDYLTTATKAVLAGTESECSARGKHVVIIGNGDTATDCVATAVRQGAVSVTQLVRKPAPSGAARVWPYPARTGAPDYGQEEAIARFGHDPRLYETVARRLETDENGALTAVTVDTAGQEQTLPAELLLLAAGFSGAEVLAPETFGLTLDGKGRLGHMDSFATENEKVFVAGDMRRGASLVAIAIAEGRDCAKAVDEYLEGYTNL